MIRLCLSGAPYCSGLNPCETCHVQVMTRVLPKAMIAGGFNQNPVQAKAFFDAYVQGWKELQASLPANAQLPLFQATPAPAAEPPPPPLVATAPEPQASPTPPAPPSPVEQHSAEPESLPLPTPPQDAAEAPIPPPIVEGLTGAETDVPDAPISESVPKKHRRRGLPRSLRRTPKKAAGSNDTKKED